MAREGHSFFFLRPARIRASSMIHWSWPLVLRNSSAAHRSTASSVWASMRSTKLLVPSFATAGSIIQGTRVDDRLGVVLGAEDDEQVAHHGGLALFVELYHAFFFQVVKGQFDH